MQQLDGSRKFQNGIQVIWNEQKKEKSDFFSFDELVEMQVNAFDLLNNPRNYRVDPQTRRVESAV